MLRKDTVKVLTDLRREVVHASQAFELALLSNESKKINELACYLQDTVARYQAKAARMMQLYEKGER